MCVLLTINQRIQQQQPQDLFLSLKKCSSFLKLKGSEKASSTPILNHKIWGPHTALRWLLIAPGMIILGDLLAR